MPRKDRTFSVSDILRIIDENLTALEAEEVRFAIRTGRMRKAIGALAGEGTENRLFKILGKIGFKAGR